MEMVVRQLRLALRAGFREPAFSLAVVLTLAIGIGANGAMFSLVHRLLLAAPPHVSSPDRVVRLETEFRQGTETFTMSTTSFPVFEDLRAGTNGFAGIAAATPAREGAFGEGVSLRIVSVIETSNAYFAVLGTAPSFGRFYGKAGRDERARVVVLGYGFWKSAFSADRSVLGRPVRLNGHDFTVVGIAPPDFTGDRFQKVDMWIPFSAGLLADGNTIRYARGMNVITLLGRLRPGASGAQAAMDATAALQRGAGAAGVTAEDSRITITPITASERDASTTEGRIALWLAGVSSFVLLIAVANVCNLMLLRGVVRRRDIALHLALGASRWNVVGRLFLEALVLATAGGIAGCLLARWGGDLARILLLPDMPAPSQTMPSNVLAITTVCVALAALVTGILPAWRNVRVSVSEELKAGARSTGYRNSKLLGSVLVLQNALCVMLLIGAGLFVRSLHEVRTQDLGFSTRNVLLASMRSLNHASAGPSAESYHVALAAVRRIPGVVSATPVQAIPFGSHHVPPISIPGRPEFPDANSQLPFLYAATPEYFAIMGMRMVAGRNVSAKESALVVVINEAMAAGLWPGESALGKCIRIGGDVGPAASPVLPCRTIIGVVSNARPRSIRAESGQALMQYYVPFEQMPAPPSFAPAAATSDNISALLIKTATDADVVSAIQRAMRDAAPALPPSEVVPLQDLVDHQIRPWTLGATMFTLFGTIALVLAALGLYGVRAYAVTQRVHEMGVRIALGASARGVMRLVVAEGLRIAVIGIASGGAIAMFAVRYVEPVLFDTSPRDPLVIATVVVTMVIVAVAASIIPARRASRVEPIRALRAD